MTLWVALFVTQVYFISSKRVKLHQKLGMFGVALGIVLIVVGFFTAAGMGKNGSASAPPEIPSLSFMVVPMFDLIMFAILFGAAIYFRKRPQYHKPLMLLTAINFLGPPLGRIQPAVQALGPLWFFGVPTLLIIVALVYDTWRNRRLNPVFLAGALLLIASFPVRMIVGFTEPWLAFAGWVTSWAA
jgi:hypothetical protein